MNVQRTGRSMCQSTTRFAIRMLTLELVLVQSISLTILHLTVHEFAQHPVHPNPSFHFFRPWRVSRPPHVECRSTPCGDVRTLENALIHWRPMEPLVPISSWQQDHAGVGIESPARTPPSNAPSGSQPQGISLPSFSTMRILNSEYTSVNMTKSMINITETRCQEQSELSHKKSNNINSN